MYHRSPKKPMIFLTLLLAVVLAAGLFWYYSNLQSTAEQLSGASGNTASFQDETNAAGSGQSAAETAETTPEANSVYEKLSAGEAARIAVIGDTFGAGDGATDGNGWDTQLQSKLKEAYGSDVTIDNYSVSATTAYQGYCTVMNQDWDQYDLAIICFGSMDQNGELATFQRDYESIIRNLRSKNAELEIMPMISTYVSDSNYSGTIRNIAEQYSLSCLNMNNAFVDSGMGEDELTNDGIYPNDEGYSVYAGAIFDVIAQNITEKATVNTAKVKAQYDGVQSMDECTFLSADDLTDTEDGEYEYTGEASVLGISYQPSEIGEDSILIMVNGYTVDTIDCTASNNLDSTRYTIAATDLTDDDTVTIVVYSDGGAVFNGITVSK